MAAAKKNTAELVPVIVTTEHRGVFFGWLAPATVDADVLELDKAQLCIYWSSDVKGFMGLAATGPSSTCRVGPPAKIRLRKITSVISCSPESVTAWEAMPWGK